MEQEKNAPFPYRKYMWVYLGVTFGLSWGLSLIYVAFQETLTPLIGVPNTSNPLVVLALNSPSMAGIFVYFLLGGGNAVLKFLECLIPKRGDLVWATLILSLFTLFLFCMHYGSMLFRIPLPEVTLSPKERLLILLRNVYEETGLLGGAFGWYGFVLPYFQMRVGNSVKAGLLTGFVQGLFVLPGYLFTSFETATAYPFYVLQLMLFSVFIAFVFNETEGNVLYFILAFWFASAGAKMQLYYFNVSVQILEIIYFAILSVFAWWWIRHFQGIDPIREGLCCFPNFIESGSRQKKAVEKNG